MNKKQFCLSDWAKKHEKILFWILLTCIWGVVFLFTYLTPRLSDDFSYGTTAREIHSVADVFRQEYEHYLGHSGRSIVHLFVRTFLKFNPIVFDILNGFVFTGLLLLMYANVVKKKAYDLWVLMILFFLMWFKAVSFEETILWQVGATNYLWGACIILGYVTLYRHLLSKEKEEIDDRDSLEVKKVLRGIAKSIGVFVFGLAAGWCNENTSGGGLLLCLAFLGIYLFENKKRKPQTWMLAGLIGQLMGLFMMVMSPGERMRAAFAEEEHSGILKIFARIQKLTLEVKEEFFLLLAIFALVYILCRIQKRTFTELRMALIYLFVFFATVYALMLAAPAQNRAVFGAGVFLNIALVNALTLVDVEKEDLLKCLRYGVPVILAGYFMISFLDDGANLYRIHRDEMEREAYIEEQKAAGENEIVVAQMRPDFETAYSAAYKMDLTDDPEYWINIAYEEYYGVESIIALPREEWEELVDYEAW